MGTGERFPKSSLIGQGRGQMELKISQLQPVSLPPTQLSFYLDSETGKV